MKKAKKKTIKCDCKFLELFKIFPYAAVSIVPKLLSSCYQSMYSTKLKQLNSMKRQRQQSSEIYFLLKSLRDIYSKEGPIFKYRDV